MTRKTNPSKGTNQCFALAKKTQEACQANGCHDVVVNNTRYQVCGTHKKHIPEHWALPGTPLGEPQLITHLDPQSPQPMKEAVKKAGKVGVVKASELLASIDAKKNPITNAWLTKEDSMHNTNTHSIDGVGNLPPGVSDGMHEEYVALAQETMHKHQNHPQLESMIADQQLEMDDEGHFIVTFTGSSSLHGDWKLMRAIKDLVLVPTLKRARKVHPNIVGRVGGAPGFDYVAARALQELEIPYDIYLPSPTYVEYYWNPRGKANPRALETITERDMPRITEIIDNAHARITVCEHHGYGKANFMRNEAMVNGTDRLWVYNPTTRGTKHAYDYAKEIDVKCWVIDKALAEAMNKEGTSITK